MTFLFISNNFFICFITDDDQKYLFDHKIRILMISEGSCDTEDWSNDAENSQE